jgi:hypothetical protein
MPTPNKRGRPKVYRQRVAVTFSKAELERIDTLRKAKPRGVYLGALVMTQPLDPFTKFRQLQRADKRP